MIDEDWAAARQNRIVWALLAATVLVDVGWLMHANVVVEPSALLLPASGCAGTWIAAAYYRYVRGEARLAAALDCIGQMIGFTAVGALLSYLFATLDFPLQDRAFHAADIALGLDWRAYLKMIDAAPWLGALFSVAYASLIPQLVLMILVLCFSGEQIRARTTILAMILAGLIAIVISGFLPAMAMFVHLGLGPADYPNLKPAASFVHLADMQALRSGHSFLFDLGRVEGIITFPSYHAALGLLAILGSFANRWARWPFLILNLIMIAATPIDGGHYFVDVLAGLAIAALCYLAASRMIVPATRKAALEHEVGAIRPVTWRDSPAES
jgi:membrane-associated phospholipid phosphatase